MATRNKNPEPEDDNDEPRVNEVIQKVIDAGGNPPCPPPVLVGTLLT